jgi:hypothetical protein
MDVWIYIVVIVIYVIFSAFRKAETPPENDQEGKNNIPGEKVEEILIHKRKKAAEQGMKAEYEQQKKERSDEQKGEPQVVTASKESKSLEGMSLEDFLRPRVERKPVVREKNADAEREKKNHYSEESLVKEYDRTRKLGQQIKHHAHEVVKTPKAATAHKRGKSDQKKEKSAAATESAYSNKEVKQSRIRKLIRTENDIRRAFVVNLLLERKDL